jgi:hypothetical protein
MVSVYIVVNSKNVVSVHVVDILYFFCLEIVFCTSVVLCVGQILRTPLQNSHYLI